MVDEQAYCIAAILGTCRGQLSRRVIELQMFETQFVDRAVAWSYNHSPMAHIQPPTAALGTGTGTGTETPCAKLDPERDL